MLFIYILYSVSADKFYIGYSDNPLRRLHEHNTKPFNTFTSKYRPWELKAVFECGLIEKNAMQIEKFIKQQKSRRLIEKLVDPDFIPNGFLAHLVRVPHMRD
ncbi:MAG TPA: GIY-YIG nuclease family protein [Parafilimonas sp.]|nr:GIY-YIG nuclease family protein [Parafilimonas sp.]